MRPLSLKIASLLAAMFLFNFSCQDHVVPVNPQQETPQEIAPVIHTPKLKSENTSADLYRLKVEFSSLGNVPIIEYGVVYSIELEDGSKEFTTTPTIANTKSIFPTVPKLGEEFKITEIDLSDAKQLFYRAYVIYGNNKVAYGEAQVYN